MHQKEEVTPGNIAAWTGIVLIAAFSFALTFFQVQGNKTGVDALAILFLFDAVMIFLLFQVAERRKQLYRATMLELNKLRRIYHVSKNLAAVNRRYREWFTALHGHLYNYLGVFESTAKHYDDSNPAFRNLSYHVYTIPEIETRKEEVLFAELLNTTAVVAETRQKISELWDHSIPAIMRVVAIVMTIGFAVTVLNSDESPIFVGFALFMGLATVFLIFVLDALLGEREAFMKLYSQNISRLELGRREE